MQMKTIEKKILKYLLILIGIFILKRLSIAYLPILLNIYESNDIEKGFLIKAISPIIINIFFGLILFFDCRKEIHNYYTISILGAIVPIVGLMFYFIESFSFKKNLNS